MDFLHFCICYFFFSADCGGLSGLFLGFSMLSIVSVIEWLIERFLEIFQKFMRKKEKSKIVDKRGLRYFIVYLKF
jgi:flagellar biosynthesis protein FlhB